MYVGGGLIPTYLVMRYLGLRNNFLVYILPGAVSAYYVILIKTFIEQLPESLEESAKIEGAGTFTCWFKIIMPLSNRFCYHCGICNGRTMEFMVRCNDLHDS